MFIVKNDDIRIKHINEIKEICAANKTPVMIFGGGIYGNVIAKYLCHYGITSPIVFVVDDEYITKDQIASGFISFSEYLKEYAQTAPLVFGFYNYQIIMKKREMYMDSISHMYDFHITVVNDTRVEWHSNFVNDNIETFIETYNMLSDEKSKHVMQCYINAATVGEFERLFLDCYESLPYFSGELSKFEIDKLFDCGAFDGDSAHDFISVYRDYTKIYEFEPDEENVKKIKARVKNESIRDLEIIQKGVWSETKTLYFRSEGKSSSAVSESGDVSIDVICLDDMYSEFTHNSLIKMDIEGSELEALKGAEKVISEISPALAICVYHKRDDLITIPQYIKSIVKEGTYKYYIGYQGLDLAELVFYAIPC